MPGITDLLGSDTDNTTNFMDENSLISSVSDTLNMAETKSTAARKPRKRKCVTMPKKPRATKAAVKAEPDLPVHKTGAKRKARTADIDADEDDVCEVEPARPKPKTKAPVKSRETVSATDKAKKPRAPKKTIATEEVETEEPLPSPVAIRSNFATSKTSKAIPKPITEGRAKKAALPKATKSTAQPTENVVSDPEDEEDVEMVKLQPPRKRVRTESRVRPEPVYRRRAGSVSDTERGDPMLRRKLGDITRKYENMEVKYRNLKEVAVTEANTNVERLQKECDNIKDASAKLVSSLKQQLAETAPLAQENRKLKKDVQTYESDKQKLQASRSDLSMSLAAAQAEIKSLQTKLAVAKVAPPPAEVKVPASVHKPATYSTKSVASTSNELTQKQQLKLDLYSDLTGLIVRDVKQTEDGDTFDCIQTGREGRALHFKLFIDHEEAKKSNHDEQEFLYTPFLDASRDRDLIDIMPSYLLEDITFAREVAARFYGRVVETVMKKAEVLAEDESE